MELIDTHCHLTFDAGMHVAFGGSVTRPGAKQAKKSAAVVREDRFLLETDAPSIGLDGVEPEKTEPHHVADIAAKVAEIRGENVEHIAAVTTTNANRLFRFETTRDSATPSVARRLK